MSMSAVYTSEWRKWWQPEDDTKVTYYQFMAKDNVPFHSVMFPATLFATERKYTFANHIMATGLFLTFFRPTKVIYVCIHYFRVLKL